MLLTYNSKLLFQANDVTREGVFKHHTDKTDVTWFSPKWNCWGGMQYYGSQGGDAIKLGIAYNFRMNGAWCDAHGYKEENYFICERSKEGKYIKDISVPNDLNDL